MVKQTKKGSIGKKALSAILAASMIMTSSSFVMAAPVVEEVEPVAVVEEVAAQAEEVDVEDENAGAVLTGITVTDTKKDTGYDYNGKAQLPALEVKASVDGSAEKTLDVDEDYTVTATNNTDAGTANYTVKFNQEKYPGVADKNGTFEIGKATVNVDQVKVTWEHKKGLAYNGKEQYPTVKEAYVTFGTAPNQVKVPLSADDYKITANNKAIDAGVYTAKLTEIGNDNFTVNGDVTDTQSYTIGKVDFTDSLITVESKAVTADGVNAPDADITLKIGDAEVAESEYDIKYYDPYDADKALSATPIAVVPGTYKVQLTPKSTATNFVAGGKIEATYVVEGNTFQKMVDGAAVQGATEDVKTGKWTAEFTGSEQKFEITTIDNLQPGQFKAEAVKGTELGTYQIVVTGLREYAGQSATVNVEIIAKQLTTDSSDYTISATRGITQDEKPSDKVFVSITDKNRLDDDGVAYELVEGTDYKYTVNKNEVIITGIGNYTTVSSDKVSTIKANITASDKINLKESAVTATISGTYAYTGKEITPQGNNIKVVDNTGANAYTLKQDVDYTLSYENNTNAGEATVIITGAGKYEGNLKLTFTISGTAFDSVFEVRPMKDQTLADAQKGAQSVYVVYKATGAYAGSGVSTIKYFQNGKEVKDWSTVKAGTIDVEVSGTGEYVGTIKTSYQVIGTEIKEAIASIEKIKDQEYTGSEIKPAVKITPVGGKTLAEGKDYTVSYENNIKVGEARVVIAGIGDYSGKVIVSFNIVGEMDQEISVLPAQEKALKTRTLNSDATKVKFTKSPETTVTYASSDEDVVTVDANGNIKYTGLGTATITIKAAAEKGYKEAVKELEVTVGLAQPTFTPFSKNDAFTLTTNTVKGAKKFQVQYVPAGKAFTNAAAKTKTFTVDKKLKQGKITAGNKKTYRIRVRAINGSTKSKWSKVKTVATK